MLTKEKTDELSSGHRIHPNDTGSTAVQVALLTERIRELTEHLRAHRKDHHSQRGLMKLVGQRRRLLRYFSRSEPAKYRALITKLGLRK
ncbi:MAG: 30S ribosomal protein S15 [Chloroflexi bacterium]|nr:MAG: 30S ribosomal protein S15 [Chloroflexota bacterium]